MKFIYIGIVLYIEEVINVCIPINILYKIYFVYIFYYSLNAGCIRVPYTRA